MRLYCNEVCDRAVNSWLRLSRQLRSQFTANQTSPARLLQPRENLRKLLPQTKAQNQGSNIDKILRQNYGREHGIFLFKSDESSVNLFLFISKWNCINNIYIELLVIEITDVVFAFYILAALL